ncbi:MAG: hypothetical protein J5854_05710 [Clostridia bacterium]|nr:hypothetical protein [Clostridia bacterium]
MNRFFRTAFSTSLVYLVLALIAALITGKGVPLPAFTCLYFGLLIMLLPYAMPKLAGREALFALLGVLAALAGCLFLLLFRCAVAHYLAHLMGMLAAALFMSTLKHRTTHDDFAAKFRFAVIAMIALIASVYFSILIGITEEIMLPAETERVRKAFDSIIPIAIITLMTGVLLLRGLRGMQGSVNEKAFNRRQLRDVVIYASAVTAVFVVSPYFHDVLVWLMNKVVRPAFRWILWAINRLLDLMANKKPLFDDTKPELTPVPDEDLMPLPTNMVTELEPESYKIDEAAETGLYKTLVYIMIGIAAAVLIVILVIELRKLIKKLRDRGGSRGRGYPNEIREALDDEDEKDRADKPKKRSPDPRVRIRWLYAEFLRFLRRVPVRIKPSDTCGNINDRTKKALRVNRGDLSEFRDIYEQARYNMTEAPTDRDAARMKTLLDSLKKHRE